MAVTQFFVIVVLFTLIKLRPGGGRRPEQAEQNEEDHLTFPVQVEQQQDEQLPFPVQETQGPANWGFPDNHCKLSELSVFETYPSKSSMYSN